MGGVQERTQRTVLPLEARVRRANEVANSCKMFCPSHLPQKWHNVGGVATNPTNTLHSPSPKIDHNCKNQVGSFSSPTNYVIYIRGLIHIFSQLLTSRLANDTNISVFHPLETLGFQIKVGIRKGYHLSLISADYRERIWRIPIWTYKIYALHKPHKSLMRQLYDILSWVGQARLFW